MFKALGLTATKGHVILLPSETRGGF